ncbi:MAG TPA: protein kinase [Chloroflexia bacterium]|nr:protein kinase [Chloroflexia bacterium]
MGDLTGKTLGRYRIMERIGRGGMAEVYKGYQPSLDRYVAVKVLHSFLLEEEDSRERFSREARAVAALRHPNIVQVFDFDEQDGIYFMVMEFIDGPNLKTVLQDHAKSGTRLPLERVQEIVRGIGGALGYAHRQGMIHRDVKPHNIMFTAAGEPLLTDFGIAKIVSGNSISASGVLSGTPAYMSPEQGRSVPLDSRTDIYSLGVVLYEMVTGRVPFDADTPFAVVIKHINDPLPLPRTIAADLSEGLERVVLKAMSKAPEDRYAMAEDLVRATEHAIQQARQPAMWPAPPANMAPELPTGSTVPIATTPWDAARTAPVPLQAGASAPPPVVAPAAAAAVAGGVVGAPPVAATPSAPRAAPGSGTIARFDAGRVSCSIAFAVVAAVILLVAGTSLLRRETTSGPPDAGAVAARSATAAALAAVPPTATAPPVAALPQDTAPAAGAAGGGSPRATASAAAATAQAIATGAAVGSTPPPATEAPSGDAPPTEESPPAAVATALAAQDNDAALAAYTAAIAQQGYSVALLRGRGETYMRLNQAANAVADFKRAIALAPRNPVLWVDQARAYVTYDESYTAQPDLALASVNHALELDPRNGAALAERAALHANHRNEPLLALADITRAIQIGPATADMYALRAEIEGRQEAYPEQLADLGRAIAADRTNPGRWQARAEYYMDHGRWDDALADLTTPVVNNNPSSLVLAQRSQIYLLAARYPEAIKEANQSITSSRDDPYGYWALALILMVQHNYPSALDQAQEALKREPRNGNLLALRGSLYLRLDQLDLADADFTAALEADSENADAFLGQAELALARHQPDEASDRLQQWEENESVWGRGYLVRAAGEAARGQLVKARADLDEARKRTLYPDEQQAAESLAEQLKPKP